MAAKLIDDDLECPVCHDDFQDPKILPCTHLVCRKCIISWLSKEGSQGGCPLCRVMILPSLPTDRSKFHSLVDGLPTDLVVQASIESRKLLNSPHVCSPCDDKIAASAYCLQCNMKLCRDCAKYHKKIPSLQSHVVEGLDTLTAERLAGTCRMMCQNHPDRLVELYCSSHQELICMLCFPTNHRDCPEVKAVGDVAHQKRAELKKRAAKLLKEEAKMASQIHASKNEYKGIHKKVEDVFKELQCLLCNRRLEVVMAIQEEEEAYLASLSRLERERASVKAHAETVKNLALSAANDALLGMMGKLTSRLEGLEQSVGARDLMKPSVSVAFSSQQLRQVKKCIAGLGQIQRKEKREPGKSAGLSATASPPGHVLANMAAMPQSAAASTCFTGAKIFKIGTRVKRSAQWRSGEDDGRGPGMVVGPLSLPHLDLALNIVKVKWDKTRQTHEHATYELELW
ncbi:E3 ubiquitin/ISG15 ligase TRIM25-like [Babylonia areolata]|uniref:E3 ubiquitin/ISG15 ligase TRIM25-like n=1 Tax=Babylonia areolata TaxID=304850 RepID=UPI003FD500C2